MPIRRLACVLSVIVGVGASHVHAQAPEACSTAYAEAEQAYYAARFEQAVETLQPCLNRATVRDSARVRAYRLLSFVHLGRNERNAARLAVESLIDLRPTYEPNPARDRPDFVALVREVKASRERPVAEASQDDGRRWLRWVMGGLGAAALGTTAALVLGGDGGGDDPQPLPPPDVPPQ
jgi:hypothetical protein